MTITAKIIADSVSPSGKRITTMQLRYPRFIHAEFMTHRMFSRNASSSRAIPVERMIADLEQDSAMPVFWGSNKPGMQAGDELIGEELLAVKRQWLTGMDFAIETAKIMVQLGLHKQIANRILEPWAHINVLVTATEWENFFHLRCHPDAQPEMHALAMAMRGAMEHSKPKLLQFGQWHLPFADDEETNLETWAHVDPFGDQKNFNDHLQALKQVSTARCARVSYLTFDGKKSYIHQDIALYNKLIGSDVLHASPAEHQATPDTAYPNPHNDPQINYENPELHGNFIGWIQHRKMLPNENII